MTIRGSGVILMYHRVDRAPIDPWSLVVSPEHFEQQMAVLRLAARPVTLPALAADLAGGVVMERSVVVTFDDGYADNLEIAKPILERHGIPATVFVVSGQVDGERPFWWDTLEMILLGGRPLPEVFDVIFAGLDSPIDLAADAVAAGAGEAAWRAWEEPVTPRQRLYRMVWERLQPMDAAQRAEVLQAIETWAGVGWPARAPRVLRPDQVCDLAAGGLVQIGAHTVTHPSLATLPPERQRAEIRGSLESLRTLCGAPIRSFSYPYGAHTDDTLAIIRQTGVSAACGTAPGVVRSGTDPLCLPRMHVEDWDAPTFHRRLSEWMAS